MQAKTSCALKSYNNITQKLVVIDSLHPLLCISSSQWDAYPKDKK